jgi:hypothetical protein
VTYTSSTPDVCTVPGATLTTAKAGTCTVTASQPGDDEYAPAQPVTGSFPVQKIPGLDDVFQGRAGLARRLAGHPQDSRAGSPDRRRDRGLSPGRSRGSWKPIAIYLTSPDGRHPRASITPGGT